MPHYKNGREAKLGDEVIGQGYNVKHPITGVVIGIKPGADTCNLTVVHAIGRNWDHMTPHATFDYEYGQADAFLRVDDYVKLPDAEKAVEARINLAETTDAKAP